MSSTLEQKEYWKQQRDKHKEHRHNYAKQYYQQHKEQELERAKQWREATPDKIQEYRKQELIKHAEKVICGICGKESTKHNLKRHQQSKHCSNQAT